MRSGCREERGRIVCAAFGQDQGWEMEELIIALLLEKMLCGMMPLYKPSFPVFLH